MQAKRQSFEPEFSPRSGRAAIELKSAIRLGDFWTAFGAQGMVAMAWTLGAMNAARIRNETGMFPFLQLTAGEGSAQSFLLAYLAKLSGKDQIECREAEHTSIAGMSRALAMASSPIILSFERERSVVLWEQQLKPLYSNSEIAVMCSPRAAVERFKFSGAVILVRQRDAFPPSSIQDRSVEVARHRLKPTPARRAAADALSSMDTTRAALFLKAVAERRERILSLVKERTPDYAVELAMGGWSLGRDAVNHGQLLALLDALGELLDLSGAQLESVRREIRLMSMTIPF